MWRAVPARWVIPVAAGLRPAVATAAIARLSWAHQRVAWRGLSVALATESERALRSGGTPPQDSSVHRLLSAGRVAEADSLALTADASGRLNADNVLTVLSAHCREHRYAKAASFLPQLLNNKVEARPGICDRMLRALVNSNDARGVLALHDLVVAQQVELFDNTLALFVHSFATQGDWTRVATLEQHISQLIAQRKLTNPSVVYSVLVNAHAKSGRLEDMQRVLERMREEHLTFPAPVVSTAMAAFRHHGALTQATALWDEAVAQPGVKLNEACFNELLAAHAQTGNLPGMRDALARRQAAGLRPDQYTFRTLLDGYGRAGAMQEMQATLNDMRASGFQADLKTCTRILAAFRDAGRWSLVRDMVEQMRTVGMELDTVVYTILLEAQGRAGEVTRLRDTMAELRARGLQPNRLVYTTLIRTYGFAGWLPEMEEAWRECLDSYERQRAAGGAGSAAANSKGPNNLRPDVRLFGLVMSIYGRRHDTRKVEATRELMQRYHVAPDAAVFRAMTEAYAGAGDAAGCVRTLQEMQAAGFELSLGAPLLRRLRAQAVASANASDGASAGARAQLSELLGRTKLLPRKKRTNS